jgi:hypothetical protein
MNDNAFRWGLSHFQCKAMRLDVMAFRASALRATTAGRRDFRGFRAFPCFRASALRATTAGRPYTSPSVVSMAFRGVPLFRVPIPWLPWLSAPFVITLDTPFPRAIMPTVCPSIRQEQQEFMKLSPNARNLVIVALAMLACFAVAVNPAAKVVNAQNNPVTIAPSPLEISVAPGGTNTGTIQITLNPIAGTADRTFTFSVANTITGFTIPQPNSVIIASGQTASLNITVTSSSTTQAPGRYGPVTINYTATGTNVSQITGSFQVFITVTGATFTPTPSLTPTNAPPTNTPTRGNVCTDGFEPDNDRGSAKIIDVNTIQEHTICPSGDVDWLVFGGVGGKVYTIDITRMDAGIDLSLELYDDQGRVVAFNDDYYNRDPANPNPGDIRPRIQSVTIPYDGRYYIRVRDSAGRGGTNYFYNIALLAESYGPTPTNVVELCIDLFEPDGLPEQARLITSNEIQELHRLCPTGDADWVTFFGKAGKRYILFTDTRRYRGDSINGETQAGADTVMVLTDRDGVSLIDFNDDIAGGNSLDSQVEFIPSVDGFYFVQIKNVGDIGNQFIRYDLSLLLCLPGQTDCGRTGVDDTQPVNPVTPNPTGTPVDEFVIDPTRTPTATAQNVVP